MSCAQQPRHLMVRVRGEESPLYTTPDPQAQGTPPDAFTVLLAPDDPQLALPPELIQRLTAWSRQMQDTATDSPSKMRKLGKEGLVLAQSLAKRLGPLWVVRFWDERHRTAKFVCWGCNRLHWSAYEHDDPPHPLHISVEGEFKWSPLRAEGFGDFAPDDPAAGLDLPDDVVADFYQWAKDIDAAMNRYLRDRDEAAFQARHAELDDQGRRLADRLAREVAPGRSVVYAGLA